MLSLLATAAASNDRIVTAIFSRVSDGYHRTREPDGSYKRVYYALTPGHYYPGVGKDGSIDPVKFPQVAGLAAQLLATKNYWFAKNAGQATLLLEISWGKTIPFNDAVYRVGLNTFLSNLNTGISPTSFGWRQPAGRFNAMLGGGGGGGGGSDPGVGEMLMFEDMRRKAVERNAKLLGYVDEINYRETPARFAGLGTAYDDLVSDIENERYYIIIAAYDFAAAKAGQMKRLWITRVSVQAQGNRFNESAAYMLAKASKYFGQDSGRLIRQFDPEGKVTLGELQVVGIVPESEAHPDSHRK
ncbi:MAG TPA: hypothetical protein VL200_04250 [Lacunisphaera sp.]|nr:hypothetical protein [Lacunisphaera sp.]